jgi:very-short-patch-repair endonuclease
VRAYANQSSGTIDRARELRRNSTDAERRLWRALRSKLPQYKWRRQMPVGPYFADFACFAEKLIIEIDGGQHASAQLYDDRRTRFIEAQGFRVLRFWNNDVMSNADGVVEQIALSLRAQTEQRQLWKIEDGRSPSPSQPAAGPLPLPAGEGR